MASVDRMILLKKEVKEIVRVKSDSAFQDMINAGEFPKRFHIGLRRVGWFADEVSAWLDNRVNQARTEAGIVEQISAYDNSSTAAIKPVSKNESFATVLLKQPRGVNVVDTNARSVYDFHMIGSATKFYTTCLHCDVSKFRNQHGADIVSENERYQSRYGYSAHFICYRLPDREAALRIVTRIIRWRIECGALPISEGEAQHLINQLPDNLITV